MRALPFLLLLPLLAGCRDVKHSDRSRPVPPVAESPNSIPDAPLSGTIHGTPFVLRDARFVEDRRVGYGHTDILLSSGKSDSPCGPVTPPRATSVWLRLEGGAAVEAKDVRVSAKEQGPWSVHYQIYDGEQWIGEGYGSALMSLTDVTADGHLAGGLSACFGDAEKSCVSGSFSAARCPPTIDQPVRGTTAPETIPKEYLQALKSAKPVKADAESAKPAEAKPEAAKHEEAKHEDGKHEKGK